MVCSIQASAVIQEMCLDEVFTTKMTAQSLFFSSGQFEVAHAKDLPADQILYKIGMALNNRQGYSLPWNAIPTKDSAVDKESKCLSQFFDRCAGSEGRKNCKNMGASEKALATLDSDCWKQKVNSINVINRCVASRNVDMTVVCTDPVKTVPKECRETVLKKIVRRPGGAENYADKDSCLCAGTYDFPRNVPQRKCSKLREQNGETTEYECPATYSHYSDNTCWKDEGEGLGNWIVTAYNNTGDKKLSPEEIAQKVQAGDR